MTTEIQISANQQNAQKSTGPKTSAGKASSTMNALTHGLTAKDVLLPEEDEGAFDGLWDQFESELQPVGALEVRFVDRIVAALWRLNRVGKVEAGIFALERYRAEYARAMEEVKKHGFEGYDVMAGLPSPTPEKHEAAKKAAQKWEALEAGELATLGLTFSRDAAGANAFSKLSRYEAGIERALYRALHELQQLQAARRAKKGAPTLPLEILVDANSDT